MKLQSNQLFAPTAEDGGGAGTPPEGVTPLLLPQAGQTMEEGTIVGWKVKEGDRIEPGQVIYEMETDKATMEVEAETSGRVARIVAPEGAIVEVKEPVAYLAESDEAVNAYLGSAGGGGGNGQPTRVGASPAARRLARSLGVDLEAISPGSGPGGRILTADVEKAAQAGAGAAPAPASGGEAVRHPLSKMRRAIAKNLQYSKQTIPHFTVTTTIDAGALRATCNEAKQRFKCSINDFVVRASALAVREFPAFRSRFEEDAIVEQPEVNIGVAVGTEEGLTVPVVLNADQMCLEALARRTREVAAAAREGRVEGGGKGVFTISNLGMFDVEAFTAIINPPETAILAVGAMKEAVIVKDEAIRPGWTMTMMLSADHRVIDGVLAAQFMSRLKALLEAPEELI